MKFLETLSEGREGCVTGRVSFKRSKDPKETKERSGWIASEEVTRKKSAGGRKVCMMLCCDVMGKARRQQAVSEARADAVWGSRLLLPCLPQSC